MTLEQLDALVTHRLEGEVFVRTYDNDGQAVACVYADPNGLRSLAKLFNALADIDQTTLPASSLPDREGLHVHVTHQSGLSVGSSLLDIGRLDAKATGDTTWYTQDDC